MPVKVLYVTSSVIEAEIIGKLRSLTPFNNHFRSGNIDLHPLVTGVGSMATAWAMKKWITENGKPDLAINAGIAGSFNDDIAIGSVVMPVADCFADAGIEDGDRFLTLSEAGLTGADDFPFRNGLLYSGKEEFDSMKGLLKPVNAITVNTASGSAATIEKLVRKFNPDIETMEGATFFYICSVEFIPFIAVRAISNRVEPRNKNNWKIGLALEKLTIKMNEIILILEGRY
jgi:futalosine hydrolase